MEPQERRFNRSYLVLVLLVMVSISGCSVGLGRQADYHRMPGIASQTGIASYYHCSLHGRKTANGERYDRHGLTAAHRNYPFGTLVRVTNLSNGNKLVLRVNDRGPFKNGRIIDVSRRAARELGFERQGITRVAVEVIKLPSRG